MSQLIGVGTGVGGEFTGHWDPVADTLGKRPVQRSDWLKASNKSLGTHPLIVLWGGLPRLVGRRRSKRFVRVVPARLAS